MEKRTKLDESHELIEAKTQEIYKFPLEIAENLTTPKNSKFSLKPQNFSKMQEGFCLLKLPATLYAIYASYRLPIIVVWPWQCTALTFCYSQTSPQSF